MNDYTLSLLALGLAIFGQALACGLATERALLKTWPAALRQRWAALAAGTGLLALQHGYSLELAMNYGLYDLRQSILAAVAATLLGWAVLAFSRQT